MYVNFYNDHSEEKFVDFGTSFFCLRNEKSNTFCQDLSQGFDGIADNTLTGNPSGRLNDPSPAPTSLQSNWNK